MSLIGSKFNLLNFQNYYLHVLFSLVNNISLIFLSITLQKDGEFDTLISPISPSLSVASIKDEKARTEMTEATKGSNDVINIEAKRSVEIATKNPEAETIKTESSSSNSDSIVKPSGFTCKKIVFDSTPTTTASQTPSKSPTDLATEL